MSETLNYDRPDLAPAQMPSADGQHALNRYRVTGVIYARDKAEAEARLMNADIYLDAAALEARITAQVSAAWKIQAERGMNISRADIRALLHAARSVRDPRSAS